MEDSLEVWRRAWLDRLSQDVRYGLRIVRRNPSFAVAVVLTLALGIGMTTAIFSVVNAALLRPLPYPNQERLVWLAFYEPYLNRDVVRLSDFYQWRGQARSFAAMAAYSYETAAIANPEGARRVAGVLVGGDFWKITGAHAAIGHLPGPEEQDKIVLSWDLFEHQFAANPRVFGSDVLLDGRQAMIAAVLPKSFRFAFPAWWQATDPQAVEAYFSMPPATAVERLGGQAVAALKPGVKPARAQAELQAIEKHLIEARSSQQSELLTTLRVDLLGPTVTRSTRPALLLLLGAGVFVLLIATVNIANLLLSRATARQREIAIRAAVGAGRMRVTRQLLVEGIVLAVAGGAVGLLVAQGAIAVLIRLSAYTIPRLVETTVDARVLGFALAASIASGLLFGAGPAIALWRTNLHDALKAGARSSAGPQGIRFRKLLVGAELAMAMVLLAGAGLLLKSFWRMTAHPPGSDPEKVLVLKFRLAGPQYRDRPGQKRYIRELERRLEAAPGIQAAGVGNWFLWGAAPAFPSDPSPDRTHVVRFTICSPNYVKALGMRLVKGRWLTEQDPGDNVLLNESMARIAFGSADPIGHRLYRAAQSNPVVVGVVSDLKYFQLDEATPPEVYVGLQFQSPFFTVGGTIAVRTYGDPLALVPTVRKLISGIDPTQPVYHIETLEQALAESIAPRHFHLFLLGSFATAALLLAMVGIYGTIAYSVAQRSREIGVRLALGAQRESAVAMVVREGMWIALAGIALGLAAALALAPVIGKLLYEVKPNDPWALAAVAASLALTAFLACFVPALKAARIDPAITLRYE